LSEKYARDHDLDLDEGLSFRDLGVSAFDSANLGAGGNLGKFLSAVEAGLVAPGSFLLVESLDRLSRAKIGEALRLFLSILDKGITIVTLADGKSYSPGNNDAARDFTDLVVSLAIMSRAHEESATKSKRLKAAWANKRSNSALKKLTGQCPAWLVLHEDGTRFEEVPEKVAVVRRIVELVRSGQGKGAIAKRFNAEGVESIGQRGPDRSWYESYISKIAKSRALIGEFQPHRIENRKRVPIGDPISDYYPRLLSDEEFAVLQDLISERGRRAGGNRGKLFSNLFSGLIKCGYCGSTMVFVDKGIDKRGKRDPSKNRFLVCHKAKRGAGCYHVPWTYSEFEDSFFTYARRVDFEQFVTASNNRVSELRTINDQLVLARASISTHNERIGRLITAIADSDSPPAAIVKKIEELESEKSRYEETAKRLEGQRDALISRKQMSEGALAALRDVASDLDKKSGDELFLYRSRLNEYLRRVLDRILLFPGGGIRSPEEIEEIKRAMLSDGSWTEDEVAVFVHGTVHSDPRKHDRYFSVHSGDSTTIVLQPEAVAREALRRLKGYPDLLANPTMSTGTNYTMAGRV